MAYSTPDKIQNEISKNLEERLMAQIGGKEKLAKNKTSTTMKQNVDVQIDVQVEIDKRLKEKVRDKIAEAQATIDRIVNDEKLQLREHAISGNAIFVKSPNQKNGAKANSYEKGGRELVRAWQTIKELSSKIEEQPPVFDEVTMKIIKSIGTEGDVFGSKQQLAEFARDMKDAATNLYNSILESAKADVDAVLNPKQSRNRNGGNEPEWVKERFRDYRTLQNDKSDDAAGKRADMRKAIAQELINGGINQSDLSENHFRLIKTEYNALLETSNETTEHVVENNQKMEESFREISDVINNSENEDDTNQEKSLSTLKEKLDYLKQIKAESKFMETAEEKKMDMEEKGWGAGGNNPKSEEGSLNKIRKYEELEEHIHKADAALDHFNDTYEKVIITMKDGSTFEIFDSDDLDEISLAANKIQDIQFILDREFEDEDEVEQPKREAANVNNLASVYERLIDVKERLNQITARFPVENIEYYGERDNSAEVLKKYGFEEILKTYRPDDFNDKMDDVRYRIDEITEAIKRYKEAVNADDFKNEFEGLSFENQLKFFDEIAIRPQKGKVNFQKLQNDFLDMTFVLQDGSKKSVNSIMELGDAFHMYENIRNQISSIEIGEVGRDEFLYNVESRMMDLGEDIQYFLKPVFEQIHQELLDAFSIDDALLSTWFKTLSRIEEEKDKYLGDVFGDIPIDTAIENRSKMQLQLQQAMYDQLKAGTNAPQELVDIYNEAWREFAESDTLPTVEKTIERINDKAKELGVTFNEASHSWVKSFDVHDELEDFNSEIGTWDNAVSKDLDPLYNSLLDDVIDKLKTGKEAAEEFIERASKMQFVFNKDTNMWEDALNSDKSGKEQFWANYFDLFDRIDQWDTVNVNKQLYPPVLRFADSIEEIETGIAQIENYKSELESMRSNDFFADAKQKYYDEVQRTIDYFDTIIEASKQRIEMKREMQKLVEEDNARMAAEQSAHVENEPETRSEAPEEIHEKAEAIEELGESMDKASKEADDYAEKTRRIRESLINSGMVHEEVEAIEKVEEVKETAAQAEARRVREEIADIEASTKAAQEKEKTLEKIAKDHYLRRQEGAVNEKGSYSYTQALDDFVDKRTSVTYDPESDQQFFSSTLLINYDKLTRALIENDKIKLQYQYKINQATAAEQEHLQANLDIFTKEGDRLEEIFQKIATNDEYEADKGQINIVNQRRELNKQITENLLMAQKAKREIQAQNGEYITQKKLVKEIANLKRKTNAFEYTYNKDLAPGVSRPVTNEKDLQLLEATKKNIIDEIEKLSGKDNVTESQIQAIENLIASYRELVRIKKDTNNITKREMGGQSLDTGIREELVNLEKLINKSKEYGDLTQLITDKLEYYYKLLSMDTATASTLYDAQDARRYNDAIIKSIELEKIRQKIQEETARKESVVNLDKTKRLNDIVAFEQKLQSAGVYTEGAIEQIYKLLEALDNSSAKTGFKEFDRMFTIFKQDMSTPIKKSNGQIKELLNSIKQFKGISKDLFKGDVTAIQRFINNLDNIRSKYEGLSEAPKENISEEFKSVFGSIKLSKEFEKLPSGAQKAFENMFKPEILTNANKIDSILNDIVKSVYNINDVTSKQKLSFFERLIKTAKSGLGRISSYYLSMMHLSRYARDAVQAVKELDNALTELRVVSNASDYSLNQVSKQAYQLAQNLGSTTSEIVKSITDWRRLGESIEDSLKLAENAAKLSVGGLMDVSAATESLVSAMKAYGYEVQEVSSIVDKFIYIGNNYSITSEALATSLEKSSGALVAAGNSLEQAMALEVAGNTVIQDADAVSNALKAISMRLRGTKGSALSEIGEDTDGLVESASKLYTKVKQLTKTLSNPEGVEIIDKTNNSYKSTYQILLEISKVWNEIGDVQQAELLESLAGKVRGSAVAAILSQGNILEDAYWDAMNSAAGAGEQAIENSLNSIEKKTKQLNNELKNLANDVIQSNTLKGIVDFGTKTISLLDKIIPKVNLLSVTLGALMSDALKRKMLGGNFFGGIGEYFDIKKGNNKFNEFGKQDWQDLDKYFKLIKSGTKQEEALATAFGGVSTNAATLAKNIDANSKAFGLMSIKAHLAANGITVLGAAWRTILSMGIGLFIGFVTNELTTMWQEAQEATRKMHELHQEFESQKDSLEDYSQKIKELNERLKSENLTESDAYDIRSQLYDIQQELITSYGIEADKLDLIHDKYEDVNDVIRERIQMQAKAYMQNNFGAFNKAKKNVTTSGKDLIDYFGLSSEYEGVYIEELQEILKRNNMFMNERGNSIFYQGSKLNKENSLRSFYDDLAQLEDRFPDLVRSIREEISSELSALEGDEDIQAYKDGIEELIIGSDEYFNYIDAYNNYKKVVISGTKEEIAAAVDELNQYVDYIPESLQNQDADIKRSIQDYFNNLLSDINFGAGYREMIKQSLRSDAVVQSAVSSLFDLNDGEWSKTLLEIKENGNAVGSAFINAILDALHIPHDQVDLVIDELSDYYGHRGEVEEGDNSFASWLSSTSGIGSDNKTWKDIVSDYESAINSLGEQLKKVRSGDEIPNLYDIITGVTDGDEKNKSIFKLLGMDDFKTYLDAAKGDYENALTSFLHDTWGALMSNVGDASNIDGIDIFKEKIQQLIQVAAGGAINLSKLKESYAELKEVLGQMQNGEQLSIERATELINTYPELSKAVKVTSEGYQFEKDALIALINEYIEYQNTAVSAEATVTTNAIREIKERLRIQNLETEAIRTIIQLYEAMANAPGYRDLDEFAVNISKQSGIAINEVYKVISNLKDAEGLLELIDYLEQLYQEAQGLSKDSKDFSNDSKNQIDWITNSLENLARNADNARAAYDRLFSVAGSSKAAAKANAQLDVVNEKLTAQVGGFEKAASSYESELKKLGLSADEFAKVQNVALGNEPAWSIEEFAGDSKEYEKYNKAIDLYKKIMDNWKSAADTRHTILENEIQKLQNLSDVYSNAIAKYEAKLNLVGSTKKQQKYLDILIKEYGKQYAMNIAIADVKGDELEKQKLLAEWTAKENELLAKKNEVAVDNILDKYDKMMSDFEMRGAELEHGMAMDEKRGYMANQNYYKALLKNEADMSEKRLKERASLVKQLAQIEADGINSQDDLEVWWKTKNAIDDVTKSLYESVETMEDLQKAMRDLDYELFDRIQNTISGIKNETEFLANLLRNDDPFKYVKEVLGGDEYGTKIYQGGFSEEGLALLGLYETNYKTNIELAKNYAEKVAELNEELSNGSANVELIDKRDEYLAKQREAITAAEQEKDAIVDLIQEGYDKQLSSLDELSSKYMEALQAEKD